MIYRSHLYCVAGGRFYVATWVSRGGTRKSPRGFFGLQIEVFFGGGCDSRRGFYVPANTCCIFPCGERPTHWWCSSGGLEWHDVRSKRTSHRPLWRNFCVSGLYFDPFRGKGLGLRISGHEEGTRIKYILKWWVCRAKRPQAMSFMDQRRTPHPWTNECDVRSKTATYLGLAIDLKPRKSTTDVLLKITPCHFERWLRILINLNTYSGRTWTPKT